MPGIQDLLQALKQGFQDQIAIAAKSPVPGTAIPARIAQDPGQFVQNAASGVGNLVKSTVAIPGAVFNSVKNGTEPQDLQNVVRGVGSMYGGIAKDPYGSFIKDPVGTGLAITPIGGPLGKLADTGKVAEVGKIAEAGSAGKIAENGITKSASAINKAPKNASMITEANVPDDVVANYHSIFQVPRNISQNMKIKPDTIIKQLVNDGVTNVKNIDDLKSVADNVTGPNGAFPKINQIILSDVKTPVDYGDAVKAVPESINRYLEGSPRGLITTVQGQIERAMPHYPEGDMLNFGDSAYAADLFSSTQELDRLASMYGRKAYTVMGDLTNPEYERASEAIQEVSNNIKDSLDKSVTPQQYQMYKNDPRILEQLQRVPQPVAQRWLDGAKQFRDGRSIQAPYVGLSKMVEDTKDAQLSAFTKWTNAMQEQPKSQAMAQNVVKGFINPQGMVADLAAKGMQKGFSSFDKTPEDIMMQRTSGQSATLKPQGLPSIGSKIATGTKTGLSALGVSLASQNMVNKTGSNNQSAENIPTNSVREKIVHDKSISNNINPVKYSDIPSDVTKLKPDAQGQYTITSPLAIAGKDGSPLGMTETDYTTQKAQLEKDLGTLQVKYNPQVSAQKTAELQQLETKHDLSSKLQLNYDGAMKVSNAVKSAQDLLAQSPPDLLRNNPSIEALSKVLDGKYVTLAQQLQVLQKYYPVMTDSILKSANSKIATGVLNQLNNQNAQFYYQTINGITGNVPGVAQQPQMQQAPTGLPPIGSMPLGNGGSVQGQPLADF